MPKRIYSDELLTQCLADARSTIKISVTNGGTLTTIGMGDIIENSFYIDRYVTNANFIYFGTACASECGMTLIRSNTITFNNLKNARITVALNVDGYKDADGNLIDIPMGIFNVYEVTEAYDRYNVVCLDDMVKLNKTASASFFNSGKNTNQIIGEIVSKCGVVVANQLPRTYTIPSKVLSRLQQNNYTYRDWLIWVCEMTCCNAYFDENGQLRFSRFESTKDTGNFTLTSAMRMQDASTFDYSLRGVGEIIFEHDYSDMYAFPDDGRGQYSVRFDGNEFFKAIPYGTASAIIGNVQDDYFQLTNTNQAYNPFSSITISLPFLMPMDIIMYQPKGGIAFYTLISHTRWTLNGTMLIECKGGGDIQNERYTQSGTSTTSSYFISKGEIAGWKIEGNKASYQNGDLKAEINLANIGTEEPVLLFTDGTDSFRVTGEGIAKSTILEADSITATSTITTSGTISGGSASFSGAINGGSMSVKGSISGSSVTTGTLICNSAASIVGGIETSTITGSTISGSNVTSSGKLQGKTLTATDLPGTSTAPNQNALVPLFIDIATGKIYKED